MIKNHLYPYFKCTRGSENYVQSVDKKKQVYTSSLDKESV